MCVFINDCQWFLIHGCLLMQLFSLGLQVMVFSKNQSEEEIDEMHSNYSKWLVCINLYGAIYAPPGPGGHVFCFLFPFMQHALDLNTPAGKLVTSCFSIAARIAQNLHIAVKKREQKHTLQEPLKYREKVFTLSFGGFSDVLIYSIYRISLMLRLLCIYASREQFTSIFYKSSKREI